MVSPHLARRVTGHVTWTMELKPGAVSVSAGSPSGSPSRTRDGLRTTPDSGSVLLVSGALCLFNRCGAAAGAQQEVERKSFNNLSFRFISIDFFFHSAAIIQF